MGRVVKIALTGGPCGGKSQGAPRIAEAVAALGWKAVVVEEAATEEILSGVKPVTDVERVTFQAGVIMSQLNKEKVADFYARRMKNDKVLIICDRGIMDSEAYCENSEEFEETLSINDIDRAYAISAYDAVYLLASTAVGAEDYYTCENNEARDEGISQARALDYKIREAWHEHPSFKVFENYGVTFEEKMQNVINEVYVLLGEK